MFCQWYCIKKILNQKSTAHVANLSKRGMRRKTLFILRKLLRGHRFLLLNGVDQKDFKNEKNAKLNYSKPARPP